MGNAKTIYEWSEQFPHSTFDGKSRSSWPPVWVISTDSGTQSPRLRLLSALTGCGSRWRGGKRICPLSTTTGWFYMSSKYTPVFSKYFFVLLHLYILFTETGSQMHISHYNLLWKFNNVLKTSFYINKYSLHHYFYCLYHIPYFI